MKIIRALLAAFAARYLLPSVDRLVSDFERLTTKLSAAAEKLDTAAERKLAQIAELQKRAASLYDERDEMVSQARRARRTAANIRSLIG
jgi:hypothetical protein